MSRIHEVIVTSLMLIGICTSTMASTTRAHESIEVAYDTESVLKYLKSEQEKKKKEMECDKLRPVPPSD